MRFSLPAGWDVMTALASSGDVYKAADYNELADAETFVGRFTRDSISVDGKWVRIGFWPTADYTPATSKNLKDGILAWSERIDPSQPKY